MKVRSQARRLASPPRGKAPQGKGRRGERARWLKSRSGCMPFDEGPAAAAWALWWDEEEEEDKG